MLVLKSAYVSRPSVAPSKSSATSGIYTVYHRRVNQLNEYSQVSLPLSDVSFPNTITPQSYGDSEGHKRDEFIVYDGTDYRLVPVATDHKGALTITAYSGSWAIAAITDNQTNVLSDTDLGAFNSSNEPSTYFYLVNATSTVRTITFNLVDSGTNEIFNQLDNKVEFSIEGVYPNMGLTANTAYNTSFIWNSKGLNTIEVQIPNYSFVKVRMSFTNFPVGGTLTSNYNFNLEVVINKTRHFLGFPDRLPDSFLIRPENGFNYPIVTSGSSGNLTVKPFCIYKDIYTRLNLADVDIVSATGTGRKLVLKTNGTIECNASSYALLDGEILLATLNVNASSPFISSVTHNWPIQPTDYIKTSTTGLLQHRLVKVSSGTLSYSTTNDMLGVVSNTGVVSTLGYALVQINATITPLTFLQGSANGLGVSVASSKVLALTGGVANDLVLAMLL